MNNSLNVSLRRGLAAFLAAFLLFVPAALTGCSEEQIGDALDIVIDILEEDTEAPADPDPADPDPADPGPADSDPAETTPAETKPAETKPAETTPAETTPADTTPAETKPAETTPAATTPAETDPPAPAIAEKGSYTKKEDVALYLWTYKHLPDNFITKNEARDLGWEGGGLENFKKNACIGGDRFGNYEKLLPAGDWRECDIDTMGAKSRGAKRIVYTADCSLIYYTDDHYESFTLLYGEE